MGVNNGVETSARAEGEEMGTTEEGEEEEELDEEAEIVALDGACICRCTL